jgi:predicted DNA-binding antitoxin AbrB/MazE fold protein
MQLGIAKNALKRRIVLGWNRSGMDMIDKAATVILTVRAIYENGQLRPLEPLALQERESVLLQVIRQSAVQETAGILQGVSPEVVREVAEGDEFSVIA